MRTNMTIPGTYANISRCEYDDLCIEAREAIDAVVNAHSVGSPITERVALALLRHLGLADDVADDLLSAARIEAQMH